MIAPASTGRDRSKSKAVIPTDHTNNGTRSRRRPLERILIIVVIKLIEAKIEEIPAK